MSFLWRCRPHGYTVYFRQDEFKGELLCVLKVREHRRDLKNSLVPRLFEICCTPRVMAHCCTRRSN
ncbi:palindromic element RPE3 domain-containing protein [Rickettsia endosymbiont of Halotydeus destructor]